MNFKALVLVVLFSAISATLLARPVVDSTGVENQNGKKVILHKVDPKDTYYSIARKYNVKPQAVLQFNANISLHPGSLVKVPTDLPFVSASAPSVAQNANTPNTGDAGTLIQYRVAQHEYLYGIAKRFNTTIEEIKRTNNLQSDVLAPGQILQIRQGGSNTVTSVPIVQQQSQPVQQQQPAQTTTYGNAIPPARRDSTAVAATDSSSAERHAPARYGLYERSEHGVATWMEDTTLDPNKKLILHRTAPIGTVMKITNPMTNRTTFAKVVGRFTDNESTKDVILVMTKNVAESLGALDKRFRVNISYGVANE